MQDSCEHYLQHKSDHSSLYCVNCDYLEPDLCIDSMSLTDQVILYEDLRKIGEL